MIRQQWQWLNAGVFSGMVLMSSDLRLAVNTFDTVSLYAIMALHHVVQASLEKAGIVGATSRTLRGSMVVSHAHSPTQRLPD
jgi:hypothetical protein